MYCRYRVFDLWPLNLRLFEITECHPYNYFLLAPAVATRLDFAWTTTQTSGRQSDDVKPPLMTLNRYRRLLDPKRNRSANESQLTTNHSPSRHRVFPPDTGAPNRQRARSGFIVNKLSDNHGKSVRYQLDSTPQRVVMAWPCEGWNLPSDSVPIKCNNRIES